MSPNQLILVLLAITLFLISSASAQFKEFDEDCNADADCLSGSFLYCNQGKKCACVNPGVDLVHDPATKKCLIPLGTSCHLQSEVGEPNCTSGSTCIKPDWSNDPSKGFCTCDKGFQGIEKHCLPKIPQDGTCEPPSPSNPTVRQCEEFSECNRDSKKCNCIDGLVYDRQNEECTLKTGVTCHTVPEIGKEPICSNNAICEKKPWIVNPVLGLCTCRTGFVNIPNEDRCLKQSVPIGEYCEADKPSSLHRCTGLSTCQNGRCDCAVNGADIIEDKEAGKCSLAVGAPCHKIVDPAVEFTCPSNSECVTPSWSEDTTRGLCTCDDKFEINPISRTCVPRRHIGETCEPKSPVEFIPSCVKYSTCNEATKECNCWNHFETSRGDNSSCNLKGNGHAEDPCFLANLNGCTGNATCEKQPEGEGGDIIGTCKCGRGFNSNFEGLCLWAPNQYDETCVEHIQCNHRKSMNCGTGGRCACFRPESMIYNESSTECLTIVGSTGICSLVPDDDINTKCAGNAVCLPDQSSPRVGRCQCAKGYTFENNLCIWTPNKYDEACEVHAECNHKLSMSCNGGKCTCSGPPGTMVYNSTLNECFTLPGTVGNCSLNPNDYIYTKCVGNSECVRVPGQPNPNIGRCQCGKGYTFQNNLNLCIWTPKNYNDNCEEHIECNHRLSMSCNVGLCTCFEPDTMVYNSTVKECLTLAGTEGTCSLVTSGDIYTKCVQNSVCKPKPNNPTVGYCECNTGFKQNGNRMCDQTYFGGACELNSHCDRKASMSCNNEKCGCIRPESMTHNETMKECLTLVVENGICSLDENADIPTKCVDNAECKADSNDPSIGRCECMSGFDVSDEKVCTQNQGINGAPTNGIPGFGALLLFGIFHLLAIGLSQN